MYSRANSEILTDITKPDVTIGMAIYNGEDCILRAVNSLLFQSYGAFKLILADDCSSDQTSKICRDLSLADSRIEYVRHPNNLGQIKNFWYLLDRAETPFFMWASQDDWWEPEFISKLRRQLIERNDCGLSYCWTNVCDPVTGAIRKQFEAKSSTYESFYLNYLHEFLDPCVNKYYGLYRTKLLKSYCLKDYNVFDCQDNLVIDAINLNTKTVVLNEYLFNYSEVAGKIRKTLDPILRKRRGWIFKNVYKFAHIRYLLASIKLVLASDVSNFAKITSPVLVPIVWFIQKFKFIK